MALLDQQQIERVAEAIAEVEKKTDAELVTVLAKRADNYYYIPALWAALLALLVPAVLSLTPPWLERMELLTVQWLTFAIAACLFRIPSVMMRLVPRHVKTWRASNLARRQFLENHMHHTKDETGVLIFVSEAEHYIEIIADRGIDQHVSQEAWQQLVDRFTEKVKAGDTLNGFIDCIQQCGELLEKHVPATGDRNELPDRFVVL